MIGAAFAAAAPGVPLWAEAFEGGGSLGGLISAILSPLGGFGKFLVVCISLSIPSACAPTMYSFGTSSPSNVASECEVGESGTSFMAIAPIFAKVPRYVFALISTAMSVLAKCLASSSALIKLCLYSSLIPVAIVGATRFYLTLINILSECHPSSVKRYG